MALIGHLVYVAGWPAAGKSTFIEHWRNGRLDPMLAVALPTADGWPAFADPRQFLRSVVRPGSRQAGVIIHYDLMLRFIGPPFSEAEAIIAAGLAERVTIILLEAPPQLLAKRLTTRHMRRAAGRPEQVPPPVFAPRVWLLNRLGHPGRRTDGFLRRFGALNGIRSTFRSKFGEWHWRSLEMFLRRPEQLAVLRQELMDAVASHAKDGVTVLHLRPASRWRREIAWTIDGEPMRLAPRAAS